MKSTSALDFLADTIRSFAYFLRETPELAGIGFVPNIGEFGMNSQFSVLKELASVNVEHSHLQLGYESGRYAVAGGLGRGDKIGCARALSVGYRFCGSSPLEVRQVPACEAYSKG